MAWGDNFKVTYLKWLTVAMSLLETIERLASKTRERLKRI